MTYYSLEQNRNSGFKQLSVQYELHTCTTTDVTEGSFQGKMIMRLSAVLRSALQTAQRLRLVLPRCSLGFFFFGDTTSSGSASPALIHRLLCLCIQKQIWTTTERKRSRSVSFIVLLWPDTPPLIKPRG